MHFLLIQFFLDHLRNSTQIHLTSDDKGNTAIDNITLVPQSRYSTRRLTVRAYWDT